MFQELRGAKFLTLSSSTIKVLLMVQDLSKYQPCSLSNLKRLKLQQKTRKHSNPSIPPKHIVNYLLSSSLGAMVLIQEQSQQLKSSRNSSSHWDRSSHRDRSLHRDKTSHRDRSPQRQHRSPRRHRSRQRHRSSQWDRSSRQ